jgi:hypothetical protein
MLQSDGAKVALVVLPCWLPLRAYPDVVLPTTSALVSEVLFSNTTVQQHSCPATSLLSMYGLLPMSAAAAAVSIVAHPAA